MACECELCLFLAEYKKHILSVPQPAREFFETLMHNYLEIDMDKDYYKAIVKNEWPGADEIIAKYRPKTN